MRAEGALEKECLSGAAVDEDTVEGVEMCRGPAGFDVRAFEEGECESEVDDAVDVHHSFV